MTLLMVSFLLGILVSLIPRALGRINAAEEAIKALPVNPAASLYRSVALGLFMAFSGLLLAASLAHSVWGARLLYEVLGWSGVGCLLASAFCGFRYASVNKKCTDRDWDFV